MYDSISISHCSESDGRTVKASHEVFHFDSFDGWVIVSKGQRNYFIYIEVKFTRFYKSDLCGSLKGTLHLRLKLFKLHLHI